MWVHKGVIETDTNGDAQMTRSQIETRTVATLRKALVHGKRGAVVINTTRARFNREMDKLGFSMNQAYQAFRDCYDMAELENMAEAA